MKSKNTMIEFLLSFAVASCIVLLAWVFISGNNIHELENRIQKLENKVNELDCQLNSYDLNWLAGYDYINGEPVPHNITLRVC